MNNWHGIGRLGRDPEMKYLDSGKAKTTINIAVPRVTKKEGQQNCDWITVEFWGSRAEMIGQDFKKGSRIGVYGRLNVDEYVKDGEKKTKVYVTGNDFTYIDNKNAALVESGAPTAVAGSKRQAVNDLADSVFGEDEIPF